MITTRLYPIQCIISITAVVTASFGLRSSEKLSSPKLIIMGSVCPISCVRHIFLPVYPLHVGCNFSKCLQLYLTEVSWASSSVLVIDYIQFPDDENIDGSLNVAFLTIQLLAQVDDISVTWSNCL
jgi:hypothetical protein